MNANQSIGLIPLTEEPTYGNMFGELFGAATSFLKTTGDCAIWDQKCQKNAALETQVRLEEAKAAQAIAQGNQEKDQQQMIMLAGGGLLVVLVFMMLMIKK